MRLLPLATLVLLASSSLAGAVPLTVTGIPTVTDGDTLVIGGVKIRLYGIDAPESSQTCTRAGKVYGCGREAAFALADLVRNKTVTCARKDTDRYGRMVGVCTVSGTEVNRALVQQGWALPYLQYGGGIYSSTASQAQVAKRGLYAGTYQNPWDYRRNPAAPPSNGTPRATATLTPAPTPATSISRGTRRSWTEMAMGWRASDRGFQVTGRRGRSLLVAVTLSVLSLGVLGWTSWLLFWVAFGSVWTRRPFVEVLSGDVRGAAWWLTSLLAWGGLTWGAWRNWRAWRLGGEAFSSGDSTR